MLRCVVAASRCASRPKRCPATWRAKRGRPVVACKEERYKVERSFAWPGNVRRLLIRWEHLFSVYRSRFAFAAMFLCARCAPGDYPRVPDPAGDHHARAVCGGVLG